MAVGSRGLTRGGDGRVHLSSGTHWRASATNERTCATARSGESTNADRPGLRRGMKRGLIGHAQIAPQPDDLWVSDKSSPNATYQPRHAELVSASNLRPTQVEREAGWTLKQVQG